MKRLQRTVLAERMGPLRAVVFRLEGIGCRRRGWIVGTWCAAEMAIKDENENGKPDFAMVDVRDFRGSAQGTACM